MATLSDIKSSDWTLALDEEGKLVQGIDDINQCVLTILSTVRGSDPLRPTFGVPLISFIDRPVNEAIPELIRECVDQITEYEPRIEITSVGKRLEVSHLFLTFNWRDIRSGAKGNVTQGFTTNV